ncbi:MULTISPECIES: hypothetical protein [Brevibacillus]|uniref:Uncharacterized protein n=1 Tax=Brevibacillus parabrevis TaxID=54914 RepID=A0A4Y3PC21_BREPA|nr:MULTISPECIES: hypothetical protein [Brevibacillus]MDH6352975.1 hypothetical protein [Brevibacillus sp. 1238]MED1725334.1 hypothetical protein [Brevibacillus parabrevis]MED2253066.1 hypothetical protein [Brevibacillus parabrevis]NRQ55424.1 hypothetical protein [Brevibacillus sp. HD1.4A]RNB95252.1 hypothetical protein EDM60_11350 [Brevibacillus parabrevis]
MEDLFDLFLDLIDWILPLLGKFWFVILGYIGYKLLGKEKAKGKRMSQGLPNKPLTPVDTPWTAEPAPDAQQERKTVRATAKYEPLESRAESMEGVGVEQEWAFSEPVRASTGSTIRTSSATRQMSAAQRVKPQSAAPLDPREGMKWALIFGEPRSKASYFAQRSRKISK